MANVRLVLSDFNATLALGKLLASCIKEQAIISLIGQLGAGKTTLTQGIAKELGVSETVNSPTFTMLNEYDSGRLPLYHVDLYRLQEDLAGAAANNIKEMLQAELSELLNLPGVLVIEWADLWSELLEQTDHLKITLIYLQEESENVGEHISRQVFLEACGKESAAILEQVKQAIDTKQISGANSAR